jgi:CheY-like chemotaxis protein
MNFPDPNLPSFIIVDDCQDDSFLLRYRLRLGGIANPVTIFEDADAAVAHVRSSFIVGAPPELIFVDITMPGGFDLVARLREDPEYDHTKIVAATYSNHPTDLKRALELRVDGYLLKFPDADILADFVANGPWFDISRAEVRATHALCA